MKKAIIIFLLIMSIVMINKEEYIIPSDSIRLRIIPNSNSEKDIVIKEKVISNLIPVIKTENLTINQTREELFNSIKKIDDVIEKTFKENNYNKKYTIDYGMNDFPEKTYKGVKYNAGKYESLVVQIGEAKGNNYWCVLYPPLCMINNSLGKKEYKSKTIEIINKYFNVN